MPGANRVKSHNLLGQSTFMPSMTDRFAICEIVLNDLAERGVELAPAHYAANEVRSMTK